MIHDQESVKCLVKLGVEKCGPAAPFVEPLQLLGVGTGCSQVLPAEKVSAVYQFSDSGKLASGKKCYSFSVLQGTLTRQLSHQAPRLSSNDSTTIAHLISTYGVV